MASAIAKVSACNPTGEGEIQLVLDVTYVGQEIVGVSTTGQAVCVFPGESQPAAIRAAMSQAVAAEAVNQGFTCPGSGMSLPVFQKG